MKQAIVHGVPTSLHRAHCTWSYKGEDTVVMEELQTLQLILLSLAPCFLKFQLLSSKYFKLQNFSSTILIKAFNSTSTHTFTDKHLL